MALMCMCNEYILPYSLGIDGISATIHVPELTGMEGHAHTCGACSKYFCCNT